MTADPEFADAAAEDAPLEPLSSAERAADAKDPDMVLLDSADDLPAYRPEGQGAEPDEPSPAAEPAEDDSGLQFSDSAAPTARHQPAPTGRRPRSASGRHPTRGRTPGGTRRPSGRLRKGPPGRRPSQSEGSARHPSGAGEASGRGTAARRRGVSTESARHQALESGTSSRSRRRLASEHGASSTSSVGKTRGRSERPERRPEHEQAALERLQARIQPSPGNDPFMGRDLGPFKVQDFLEIVRGERHYLALHEETKSLCYLRVFPFLGSYGDEFKRLADRGERAARIEHPQLDLSLGVGRTKECFFVGTRPPWGPTLAEKLADGACKEEQVMDILEQVGRGLKALHAREMFHAHVSPESVREEAPGYFVLHASGLARARAAYSFLSAGGDVLGCPGYIAPETVDTGGASRSADIYSLGCLAWTLLAGRPPFDANDEVQLLLDQLNQDVARLDAVGVEVSPGVATWVAKMAGYTAELRYSDTTELLNDLRALRQGEVVKPFADAARAQQEDLGKKVSSGNTALIGLLLLNIAVLGFVALTWFQANSIQLDDPVATYELPIPEGE